MTTIYDWNREGPGAPDNPTGFRLVDETLRDGIQSPSVRNPTIDDKLRIVRLMAQVGVHDVNIGLPGAGEVAVADAARLARTIADERLPLTPHCAGRTHPNDIDAVAEVSQRAGMPLEVCAFLGCSPIRQMVEGWDLDHLLRLVTAAGDRIRQHGLDFSFVTEDTTRSDPRTLETLYKAAIDHGATRIVLCDTAGHATPGGLRRLVAFAREVIAKTGAEVALDWHGHNDRGLALTLAIRAIYEGIDRVHGTALGIGERVGNASMDQVLINLHLMGVMPGDPTAIAKYVGEVSRAMDVPIPRDYPVFGEDAFRTATGVHAAAIVKALAAGEPGLADRVYSSVPAGDFGLRQRIEVGYNSGRANVVCWLRDHDLEASPERVRSVLALAKAGRRTLTDHEIVAHLRAEKLLA